jgi:hypothetical protein
MSVSCCFAKKGVPKMSFPNIISGYAWQCPSCKTWFPTGQSHACGGTYQPYIDPSVLERIAKALEEIASQLTQRSLDAATYERDGLLFCKTCGSGMGAVEDATPRR